MSDLIWEISYLEKNLKPTNQLGQELNLIYASNSNLKDSNILALSTALKQNSVFEGDLQLSENHLTDQSVLYLTEALSLSQARIRAIDLSTNFLKDKSGVYLGNLLSSNYPLQQLYLKNCSIGELGVQRIFEALETSTLQVLDIGLVNSNSLVTMGNYLSRPVHLKQLSFQQAEPWSAASKSSFIQSIKKNYSILLYEVQSTDSPDFTEEVISIADRNNMLNDQSVNESVQSLSCDQKNFAAEIQKLIENDLQNLPVRVYLENSIGTLLNDGIYALMKFRYKESLPEKNTAVDNIKWLVRYILDNSRN